MKTYSIEQWATFLRDIRGKSLRVKALIGDLVTYIEIKPAALKEELIQHKVKCFSIDVKSSCAFVEFSIDRFGHLNVFR